MVAGRRVSLLQLFSNIDISEVTVGDGMQIRLEADARGKVPLIPHEIEKGVVVVAAESDTVSRFMCRMRIV